MEGFYFEIQQSLCILLQNISVGEFSDSLTGIHVRRLNILLKNSGIFDEVRKSARMGLGDKYFEVVIAKECEIIGERLNELESKKTHNQEIKLKDTQDIFYRIANLNHIINMGYMYAKTKVDFEGSYQPAFDLFEKEGI